MRAFRFFAFLCLVGVLWVVGALIWSLFSPTASRMDTFATARIRKLCGYESNCKVRLGDLFEGDWDTVYIFGAGVSQKEIDAILGPGYVRAGNSERIVVLERKSHILRAEHSTDQSRRPVDGQIEFEDEDHREQRIVRYSRDASLRVMGFPVEPHGTFYVLTTADNH
jgi:hypothetical protein